MIYFWCWAVSIRKVHNSYLLFKFSRFEVAIYEVHIAQMISIEIADLIDFSSNVEQKRGSDVFNNLVTVLFLKLSKSATEIVVQIEEDFL